MCFYRMALFNYFNEMVVLGLWDVYVYLHFVMINYDAEVQRLLTRTL